MELKNFIEIEKKYHLLDEQIEGFCFWVYGRAEIQWYIRNKIYGYSDYHSWNPRFFEQFRLRIHMMANAIVRGNIKKKQYDVLVLNSARKIWNDNHYECICTESIIKEIKNTIVLEGLYEQKHFRPVETPNLVYLDRIEMQAQLSYYFAYFMRKKKYRAVYNQIYERLIQPIKELEQIYSIEIDIKTILNFIIPEFFKYKVKKKKFYKILKKTTPKLILEVASYDPNCMVMNEVSKMCGIKTVELQHGIINREHIAYNYPSCVSVNQFPDYFFVWSDFWKNRVKCPILENRIIATGFPYLEKQIRKYAKKRIQKSEKKVVLFLSQGNIGRHLAQIAIGVYKVLDRNKYHIIFKLHPDEFVSWKNQFPELAECSDIEIIDNGKQNLYELFAKSDVQVGCFSTAIYEGLIYDLDTYILKINDNSEMDDLINLGYAKSFTSALELVDLLAEKREAPKVNVEGIWKFNALDNIKTQLLLLMAGNS